MRIAIVDADLISRRNHRFPNLACMKISGWNKNNGNDVDLLTEYTEINKYEKVYISKVFTDTEVPSDILNMQHVIYGGTGFFFDKAPGLPYDIEHCKPDYCLYDGWITSEKEKAKIKSIEAGKQFNLSRFMQQFKEYTDYSIGFLTRGCFRKCAFCVNQKYDHVFCASPLDEFYDPSRKKICLLDDNFLGHPNWKEMMYALIDTGKPFKFKQGLDERILTDEKCELLFSSKYDGDFTFAFDNIEDYELIERKLKLIRKYTDKVVKFYVFCAFDRNNVWNDFWYQDVVDVFRRIELLMKYRCLPYIQRFNRYVESPFRGIYITLARWCNQPGIFKKKSFEEFCSMRQDSQRYLDEFLSNTDFDIKYPLFLKMKFDSQ